MKHIFGVMLNTALLIVLGPSPSGSHNGEVDRYGCHQDKESGTYHCHDGMLKGGSFGSKGEMIRQLKQQFETLGRPWPYGDLIEEDITSPNPKIEEQP